MRKLYTTFMVILMNTIMISFLLFVLFLYSKDKGLKGHISILTLIEIWIDKIYGCGTPSFAGVGVAVL